MTKIAVIGGGASGFMAATAAVENASTYTEIEIFEKNNPLSKLLLTGGGRCNISNATYDNKILASNYPRGEKFLYSVFNQFSVIRTLQWFQDHCISLYTQDDGRIFPVSNDANTVRTMFLTRANELGINVKTNSQVKRIEQNNCKFKIYTDKEEIVYDKIIISTGGGYKLTEGSGYVLAKSLGHTVTELKPALASLKTADDFLYKLAGVSVKNIKVTTFFAGKSFIEESGDMLFTHNGVSGPVILKISSYCAFLNYSKNNPLILKINFLPDKKRDEIEKELLLIFDKNSKKGICNILSEYIVKSLAFALLESVSIDCNKKASQITKEERKIILDLLTSFKIPVISSVLESEMVTAGGINLDEVNSKTMESKIKKNLYFCGEVLNIDGFTGGFNLQAAWSTGYIAGINAVMN